MENELLRMWQLINELSEQLSHNQKMTATLQSQVQLLKVWATNHFAYYCSDKS